EPERVRQTLEKVAGVNRAEIKDSRAGAFVFETEGRRGELVRGDLARAVIQGGWDLNELRPATMSLEEVFLKLTGTDPAVEAAIPEQPSSDPGGDHSEAAAPDTEAAELKQVPEQAEGAEAEEPRA